MILKKETQNKKRIQYYTFRNPNVAQFLRIFHKQLALRYITLLLQPLESNEKGMKERRKKKFEEMMKISISVNKVAQMNPFVGGNI